MELERISSSDAEKKSVEELYRIFESRPEGLSSSEAQKGLEQYGSNALSEKQINPVLKFLGYFWGPIPW